MGDVPAENEIRGTVPPLLRAVPGPSHLIMGGVLVALGLIVGAVLYFFDPAQHGFYPQCILHRTTGLLCPGCGSLRALHHLLHGEIALALRLNALLVLFVPVAAVLGVRAWWIATSPDPVRTRVPQAIIWFVIGLTVVFGIFRNTPLARALGLTP